MIDFGKLYCDIHPNEIITNFCLKQTCMSGLCATCICSHTQYHVNNKTTPEYQNIRATFSSMHQTIRKKISSLQSQKNRIDKLSQFIVNKRKTVRQNIEQTRKQAIAAINSFFQKKQKSMLREMQSEQKKMGLHSQARMESLMNSLNRQSASLITSAQQLNSQNFLQSYQRIKTQTLVNASKLQEDVSRQLDRNQDFETIINSNDQYVQNIISSLQQSLQLYFKMNTRPLVVHRQNKQLISNGSSFICPEKVTSRFSGKIQENTSIPVNMSRPSSTEYNSLSTMSFSHVPDMVKQNTAKFNEERETTKSISISQEDKPSRHESVRQYRSFINQLSRSDIIKQTPHQSVTQSQLFRQKDPNQGYHNHQGLNRSSSGISRNHQSQIIIVEKPFGHQSGANWNYDRRNHHQGMNHSMIQNLQPQPKVSQNQNLNSQVVYCQNKPSSSGMNQFKMPSPQGGHKFNFVPQMFDPSLFNKGNQNQMSVTECKKVRKSGLSLLKTNQANSTSRSRLHE